MPTNLDEEGKLITDDKEKHVTILRSKTQFNGEPNRSFRLPSTVSFNSSRNIIDSGFKKIVLQVNFGQSGINDDVNQDGLTNVLDVLILVNQIIEG